MTFSTFASPGVGLQGGGGSGGTASLPISGNGATITTSTPLINGTQTWNSGATTFTSLLLNVTDTASAAASLLMDLQVGGVSQFNVSKSGVARGVFRAPSGGTATASLAGNALSLGVNAILTWTSGDGIGTGDLILTRRAAANLRLGAADAAAPVAQTLSVQSVAAGTSNTAGANLTITGSQGTGTGAGGSIVFQVAPAGSSGTAQNALATALTIDSGRHINLANMGSSIDASIVAYDSGAGVRSGFYFPNGGADLGWTRANAAVWGVGFQRCSVGSSSFFSWSSTADPLGAQDVILARDAANTLALRNGANAQFLRVYSTYTDASNYERGAINTGADFVELAAETAGTGDDNLDVRLTPAGTGNVRFGTHTATADTAVSGYIEIKDAGGTIRKLAVIT